MTSSACRQTDRQRCRRTLRLFRERGLLSTLPPLTGRYAACIVPPGTLPPSDSSLDQLTVTTHSTTSTRATTTVASTTVQNVLASDTLSYDARANSALSTGRMMQHHSAFSVVPVSETVPVSAVTAPSLTTPGLTVHGVPTAPTSSGAARSLQPTVALTGHRQDAVQAPIVPGRGVSAVQAAPLLPQGNPSTAEPVCNPAPTLPLYMLSTDDDSDSSVSLPATQPIRPSRTASRQSRSTVARPRGWQTDKKRGVGVIPCVILLSGSRLSRIV